MCYKSAEMNNLFLLIKENVKNKTLIFCFKTGRNTTLDAHLAKSLFSTKGGNELTTVVMFK